MNDVTWNHDLSQRVDQSENEEGEPADEEGEDYDGHRESGLPLLPGIS